MQSDGQPRVAWEPLTPHGVAAFSRASLGRLWLVQLFMALFVTAALLWFVSANWFPVVASAIRNLPAQGVIRAGTFEWNGDPASKLAENHFLSFSIDLQHEGIARSPSHLQIECGKTNVLLMGILGVVEVPYPKEYRIDVTKENLEPWWGAWSPMILVALALGSLLYLFACWALLALLYAPVAWLIALFADRELKLRQAYTLCGAALMPGATFMIAIILFYRFGALDSIKVLIGTGLHVLIGMVYVVAAPFFLPQTREGQTLKKNPFTAEQRQSTPEQSQPQTPAPAEQAYPEPRPESLSEPGNSSTGEDAKGIPKT